MNPYDYLKTQKVQSHQRLPHLKFGITNRMYMRAYGWTGAGAAFWCVFVLRDRRTDRPIDRWIDQPTYLSYLAALSKT